MTGPKVEILHGDVFAMLATIPDGSVHLMACSPPYFGLRRYSVCSDEDCGRCVVGEESADGKKLWIIPEVDEHEIGREESLEDYIEVLVKAFREVRRVLHPSGCVFLNLSDSYALGKPRERDALESGGMRWANKQSFRRDRRPREDDPHRAVKGFKPGDLLGVPWRVAFALQDDGWILRCDMPWEKSNPQPESVDNRPTRQHEYIFLLAKERGYFYDNKAERTPLAESSVKRMQQATFDEQTGGDKDYAFGTNPNRSARKALENLRRKTLESPRIHGRQRQAPEPGQPGWADASGANLRSVFHFSAEPFTLELCSACKAIYELGEYRSLNKIEIEVEGEVVEKRICKCGRYDAWLSHFATWPSALVQRLIRLGSSEKGCCPTCLEPWRREKKVVGFQVTEAMKYAGGNVEGRYVGTELKDYGGSGVQSPKGIKERTLKAMGEIVEYQWQPGCDHGLDPIPCTVLDIFAGSGTTAAVARELGRSSVSIEIHPDYVLLIRFRANQPQRHLEAFTPMLAVVAEAQAEQRGDGD